MYTFDDNLTARATRAKIEAADDRALEAGKRMLLFITGEVTNPGGCATAMGGDHETS
jgi:hypothetical protein